MGKALNILGAVLAVAVLAGLTVYSFANAGEGEGSMMVGVIVAEGNVALEVGDQLGATDAIVVERVLAPSDSWIVVHLDDDGMPGPRVGLLRVEKGESSDVSVALESTMPLTPNLIVALHADRGVSGKIEFDPQRFESSPDKPYFVDGEEVARVVKVSEFGVPVGEGEALIDVASQPGAQDSLVVDLAVAPADAWIVVHLDDGGMPGMRVGLMQIPAGESRQVRVAIEPETELTDTVFVAIHADRGVSREFEFDMQDKAGSPDQPYFVNGVEVAKAVAVK